MLLTDLTPKQKVYIEVIVNDKSFELPSSVIQVTGNGVKLEPYLHNGSVVDFSLAIHADIKFNLHCVDETTQTRKMFKNVRITTEAFDGFKYYMVTVRKMDSIAFSSERRGNVRMPLQGTGYVTFIPLGDTVPTTYNVELYDVSEKGVSFYLNANLDISNTKVRVGFTDLVLDKTYDINMNCTIVRIVDKEDNKKFYGCRLDDLTKDILMYLCFKHIAAKAAQRMESN